MNSADDDTMNASYRAPSIVCGSEQPSSFIRLQAVRRARASEPSKRSKARLCDGDEAKDNAVTYSLIDQNYLHRIKACGKLISAIFCISFTDLSYSGSLAADRSSSEAQECYRMTGDSNSQIAACTRIVEAGLKDKRHDYALAYHMRALGYARKNDLASALQDMNQAIQIDPENFAHYLNRANILDSLGHHEHAMDDYNNSVKFNEKCVDCYYNRGVSLGQHNDIDGAVADFKKTIEMAPTHMPARVAMARIAVGGLNKKAHEFMQQQKYTDAVDALDKAIKIIEWIKEPDDWDYIVTLTNLGEVYRKMQKYEEAHLFMEKSLAISEKKFGNDNIRTSLPLVDLALLNIEAGRFNEAKPFIDRGILIFRAQPTKKGLFIYLIQISEKYIDKSKCSEAQPYLQEAAQIHTTAPEILDAEANRKLRLFAEKCQGDKALSPQTTTSGTPSNSAGLASDKAMNTTLSCRGGKVHRIGEGNRGAAIFMCVQ